jgi:DNA-binding PadR family transcriptional regulator
MTSTAKNLTTTSYAILGLLAIRPWTTYELAQQMGRALGQFWPRAQSKLYEEPKKLVAHGLAKAAEDSVGNRPRTVYSITPRGRRALREWVPTESTPPALEMEHLVKVFFAEHGSKADLMAQLADLRTLVREKARQGVEITTEYLEGRGAYPERLPWLILVGTLLDDFDAMLDSWATWAIEVVASWPDDITQADPDLAQLASNAARNQAMLRSE